MEQTQRTHETFINQYLGERKFIRYVVPVLFGLLGSSVSALIIAAVFRALIGQMGLVAK